MRKHEAQMLGGSVAQPPARGENPDTNSLTTCLSDERLDPLCGNADMGMSVRLSSKGRSSLGPAVGAREASCFMAENCGEVMLWRRTCRDDPPYEQRPMHSERSTCRHRLWGARRNDR